MLNENVISAKPDFIKSSIMKLLIYKTPKLVLKKIEDDKFNLLIINPPIKYLIETKKRKRN